MSVTRFPPDPVVVTLQKSLTRPHTFVLLGGGLLAGVLGRSKLAVALGGVAIADIVARRLFPEYGRQVDGLLWLGGIWKSTAAQKVESWVQTGGIVNTEVATQKVTAPPSSLTAAAAAGTLVPIPLMQRAGLRTDTVGVRSSVMPTPSNSDPTVGNWRPVRSL